MAQSCQCKDALKMEANTTSLGQILEYFFWRFGEVKIIQYFLFVTQSQNWVGSSILLHFSILSIIIIFTQISKFSLRFLSFCCLCTCTCKWRKRKSTAVKLYTVGNIFHLVPIFGWTPLEFSLEVITWLIYGTNGPLNGFYFFTWIFPSNMNRR